MTNSLRRILVVLPESNVDPDRLTEAISATANSEPLQVLLLASLRLSETPGLSPLSFQVQLEEARQQVRASFQHVLPPLQRAGHIVNFHTTTGVLAVQASKLASELAAGLILVGETSPTLIERLLGIGFVDRLAQTAPCPIVILPAAGKKSRARSVTRTDSIQADWQALPPPKPDLWRRLLRIAAQ